MPRSCTQYESLSAASGAAGSRIPTATHTRGVLFGAVALVGVIEAVGGVGLHQRRAIHAVSISAIRSSTLLLTSVDHPRAPGSVGA